MLRRVPAPPVRIRVLPRPDDPTRGVLIFGALRLACRLGRGGVTATKREGDGATPRGHAMRLLQAFYRADRIGRPATRLPCRPIRVDDGWCDDASDGRYNRPVRLPCAASHEVMRRDDRQYDIVVILDWNISRRGLGRGSAIFLHQTPTPSRPTAGCVALEPGDLRRLLARLPRHAEILVR
jgi:L,D-peptidoglycan transpeptidase YkuD (ErfK/YbiS/YcfS/YnhG family)